MEPTIFKPRLKFKPPLKFFKFGHWRLKTREQALFNLEDKKKRRLSTNPDIHHSKVPSSALSLGKTMYGVGQCLPCLPVVWGVHNGTSFSDFFSNIHSNIHLNFCHIYHDEISLKPVLLSIVQGYPHWTGLNDVTIWNSKTRTL